MKNLLFFAALFCAALPCLGNEAQANISFTNAAIAWTNGRSVKEKTPCKISIDTYGINKGGWMPAMHIKLDMCERNVRYMAEFDLETVQQEGHSHIYAELKNETRNVIIKRLDGRGIGKFNRRFKKAFSIPKDNDKYILAVWVFGEAKGSFSNLKISEIEGGTTEDFVPMFEKPEPYALDRAKLPAGAKDFTVDQPNNPNGEVVLAKDFNILPNIPPKYADIRRAIDHCRKVKAKKLLFEKDATYKFFDEARIELNGLKDFIFDGNGSTFIFRRKKLTSFWVCECERVVIENFSADWDEETDPLASIVEAIGSGVEGGKAYNDYRFVDYETHPAYGRYLRPACLSPWSAEHRAVGVEGVYSISYEFQTGRNQPKFKWISPNVLRLYTGHSPKIGQLYRMQHYYYDMDFMTGISNRHLTVRNVNVWATPGHAFLFVRKTEYNYFKNVHVRIKPNASPRKCISSCADHFGAINCQGNIKLEDCEFADGADDCFNVHDKSLVGEVVGARALLCREPYGAAGAPIELRNLDFSPVGKTLKIAELKKRPDGKCQLVFEEDLPKSRDGYFLLFNRANRSNNIIMRNCTFRHNRAHGLMAQSSDITVENCNFIRNEMGAMKIESGFRLHSWCEGHCVRNMVVRNCRFVQPNPMPECIFGKEWCVFIGTYLYDEPPDEQPKYPVVKDVLFENNTFENCYGMIACIGASKNIVFTNNTFKNSEARKFPTPYRNCFYLRMAKNVKIVNNTFENSPLLKDLGVYAEKGMYKNLVVQGNKLVEPKK